MTSICPSFCNMEVFFLGRGVITHPQLHTLRPFLVDCPRLYLIFAPYMDWLMRYLAVTSQQLKPFSVCNVGSKRNARRICDAENMRGALFSTIKRLSIFNNILHWIRLHMPFFRVIKSQISICSVLSFLPTYVQCCTPSVYYSPTIRSLESARRQMRRMFNIAHRYMTHYFKLSLIFLRNCLMALFERRGNILRRMKHGIILIARGREKTVVIFHSPKQPGENGR
jgi:hypothetical protein